MTFPTIPTSGANTLLTTNQATATTTHSFPSLTTLDNASGDLLLAIIVTYQGGSANAEFSSWGGGFTEFIDQSANSTTIQSIGAAYKFSDGTETGTFTVTSVASNRSVMFLLSVKGAHASTVPEGGAKANGTTAAADPLSLNPAGWDAEDTLWIAVGVNGETSLTGSFTGITAAPTNYTNYVDSGIIGGDVIGALEGAVAFRQLNAASEDVGGFTLDVGAAGNSGLVIAVRPAAPPPVGDPYQFDSRWYRANIFFRPSAEAFQSLGDATTPADITQISLSDTGAGTDDLTITVAAPLTDTGTGSDLLTVAADVTLSDTATGDDAAAVAADVPLTDTGTGADSINVVVGAVADPYQTAPLPFPPFTAPFIEPMPEPFQLLGDAAAVVQVNLTDSGTGVDSLTVSAAVPLDDAGTGSDSVIISAAVSLDDAGAGADSIIVATGVDPNQAWPQFAAMFLQPSGASLQFRGDTSGVPQVSLTDSGAAADALTVTAAILLSDTATGDDTLNIAASLALSDTAAGTDALTVAVAVPLTDAGAAADAVALSAAVPLSDAGVGDDSLSVQILSVVDPYQALPQRFGWAFKQPEWIIPFQLLGDASTPPTAITPKAGQAVPGSRAFAGVAPGSRAFAGVAPGTTTGPSIEGGG